MKGNISSKKQERTEQILQAAMAIFSRDGYHKADVDEIAVTAGVGKGTIYRHFESKKGLFLAVVEWGISKMKDAIMEAIKSIDSPIERTTQAISTYLKFFETHRGFYRVLIQEVTDFREEVGKIFREKYLPYIPLLEEDIRNGIEKGVIKNINPQTAAFALIGMTNAIIYKWLISDEDYPLTSERDTILEIWFKGVIKE
ncbi:TetR/AcrR family transcriptional regulator [bacterium]|nr:TetR/AcrR family transcriptional regulator [bacterium]